MKRPTLLLPLAALLLAAAGCAANVSPIQRAAQTGEILNATGQAVFDLRHAGKVSDAQYRTFYAAWVAACDAQAEFERAAAAATGNGPKAADAERLASKALDDLLLTYHALKAPPPPPATRPANR